MTLGVLDFLAIAYIGYAARTGAKRGLPSELPGAISIGVFLVTGCGLYRWTGHALGEVNRLTGQALGVLGFLGLVVSTVAMVRFLRRRIQNWAARRYTGQRRTWGGVVVGSVRAFLLVSVALLVLAHWPFHSVTRPIVEGSVLGRNLTKWALPMYEKTHKTL